MTLMMIVDTQGHPGSAGKPLAPTGLKSRGEGPVLLDPWRDFHPWGTERAIFLRQVDSACWTDSHLTQSDLQLSADTVIPYPAAWRGEDTSWEAILLVANGFTLVPA